MVLVVMDVVVVDVVTVAGGEHERGVAEARQLAVVHFQAGLVSEDPLGDREGVVVRIGVFGFASAAEGAAVVIQSTLGVRPPQAQAREADVGAQDCEQRARLEGVSVEQSAR